MALTVPAISLIPFPAVSDACLVSLTWSRRTAIDIGWPTAGGAPSATTSKVDPPGDLSTDQFAGMALDDAGEHVLPAHEARDIGRLRAVEDHLGGVGLVDAAGVHHHHHVGERDRLGLGVGDVDEGDAELGLQAAELAAHAEPEELVERRERLVEEQHPRIGDQRTGERDALLLAAGKLGRHAVPELLELDPLQHLLDARRAAPPCRRRAS